MRKHLIAPAAVPSDAEESARIADEPRWMTTDDFELVEVTSEDSGHPIEHVLVADATTGWQARDPGRQIVRLHFAGSRSVRRIALEFAAAGESRTQEYVLRWSAGPGGGGREIVRQQWNFSASAPRESEDHRVELSGVAMLELEIVPDIAGGEARASLMRLRIAS